MKPEALEKIFTELIAVYENLKAEVLIAEIQENSILKQKISLFQIKVHFQDLIAGILLMWIVLLTKIN